LEFGLREQRFDSRSLGSTAIKGGVPNIIVIKSKLGSLFVELWDKTGRVRHTNRDNTIDGPPVIRLPPT
jgi:hypothetical protein